MLFRSQAYTYATREGKTTSNQEHRTSKEKKTDAKKGILQAQKILITWILEEPSLLDKISPVINQNDFSEPVYNKVAELLFEQIRNHDINPAKIINHFESEEEHREVSALFNMPLRQEMSPTEREKALNDTVRKIKKNSLENRSRKAADVKELQEIIKEQQALKSVHIHL